jgi:hypothetical protein
MQKIEGAPEPSWLMNLTSTDIQHGTFPLHDVLQNSLYYPGAGYDGKPVKWFAGNVYSFIYSDYGVSRESVLSQLNPPSEDNFLGYEILAYRDLSERELIPNGWHQLSPDFNENQSSNHWRDIFQKPYALWIIFERSSQYFDDHGPKRFSLLYICCDGAAGYQALYNSNQLKPKILFLINHGFGCNWTDFENPSKILARSVRANSAGLPDFLVGRRRNIDNEVTCYWSKEYPNLPLIQVDDPTYFRLYPSDRFVWMSISKHNEKNLCT